jgi:hypothetical protein
MERAIADARKRRRTPHVLKNIRINRVDLVDIGANLDAETGEGSHVLLWKRADGPVSRPLRPDHDPGPDPLGLTRAARRIARALIARGVLKPGASPDEITRALGWDQPRRKDKTMWHFSGAKRAEGRVRKHYPLAKREDLASIRRAQVAKIAATEYRAGGPVGTGFTPEERAELMPNAYEIEAQLLIEELRRRGAREADIRDVVRGAAIISEWNGRNPSTGRIRGDGVLPRPTTWGALARGE